MAAGKPTHRAFTRTEMLAAFVLLSGIAGSLYMILWVLDFGLMWGQTPLELFIQPGAANTLVNFGEITVGVLAVSLTVVGRLLKITK